MPNHSYLADRMDAWEKVRAAIPRRFWLRRVSEDELLTLTDILVTESLAVQHDMPATYEEFEAAVRARMKGRLRDKTSNPILLFIMLQVLGTLVSLIVRDLYERWKKKHEEDKDKEE